MTHRTIRDFLLALEAKGLMRRIAKPVDPSWELAAMAKWMFQALPAERRFGMYFENVGSSAMPVVTGALGANIAAYATALDVAPERINETWAAALRQPVAPATVERALCQELVMTGAEAGLARLPIPVWTPGKDVAPYLTTNTVTKDCDTGIQNMGVYRTMVRDAATVVPNLAPGRQGQQNVATWMAKGKVAPIAWVVGAPPAVHLAAVSKLPYGCDELTIAGGLMGGPVAMVRCKTVDLMVPADAEMVIEGEIHPGETAMEGPFGEFAGYMGPVNRRPVARITAITQRREPIFYAYTSQMPPSESTTIQSLTNAGLLYKTLRFDAGETAVRDVFIDCHFGGSLGQAVIAMKPSYPGHAKKVGRLAASLCRAKRFVVVDEDIDIRDSLHVDWAMSSRYDPGRDTIVVGELYNIFDPAVRQQGPGSGIASQIVFDATDKTHPGPFSLPAREIMDRALASWKEAGLPEFAVPPRASLRIGNS